MDDEEPVREITRRILEANGYRTVVAADGAEGASAYSRHNAEVAAVITDMMMPKVDGPGLIRVLRSQSRGLPIIAMSGLPAQQHEGLAPENRPDVFLEKPFTSEQALSALHQVLTRNS